LGRRFIINLPPEEQDSVERVFFQVEEAHWFYDDFIRKCNPNLPNLTLRAFSSKVFMQCPMIKRWELDASEAFAEFIKYKGIVPVRGAIMLNDRLDSCVLVKSLKGSSLSFPRGKINRGESDVDCAVREVYEETGCDLAGRIRPEDVLEGTSPGTQNIKLYIVPGVSMDTLFETKTRGEISDIKWMRLSEIPT
ncbi:DCP2-domain-containing protein, partial [Ascobolus immersus RN42]